MKSDLRTIDFTITEEYGRFVTTPRVALKLGIRTSEEEVYICQKCKEVIDPGTWMYIEIQEPFFGWQHFRECKAKA